MESFILSRLGKIRSIFSLYFWKQLYLLITSFITGNVWAKNNLGSHQNIDVNPTVRFGNHPENIFLGKNTSIGYGAHIYCGKDSKILVGEDTMIGPFVFIVVCTT